MLKEFVSLGAETELVGEIILPTPSQLPPPTNWVPTTDQTEIHNAMKPNQALLPAPESQPPARQEPQPLAGQGQLSVIDSGIATFRNANPHFLRAFGQSSEQSAQSAQSAQSTQQIKAKAKDDEYRQSASTYLTNLKKPRWFKQIFNFDETNDWKTNIDKFRMDGDYLVCDTATRANCNRQYVGKFVCLSLASLKDYVNENSAISDKGLSFAHIIGNVADLHYQLENAGAVFQAASQFNCLEMVNPYYTPSHGVAVYANDLTQGPVCAMACPAALVYRNYLVKHKDNNVLANNTKDLQAITGQNSKQIDTLRNLGEVVENYSSTEPDGVYWTMENGYAFIKSKAKLEDLNRKLSISTLANSAMDQLRVGVHWETSVNPVAVANAEPHNVCQVYASALPIAYTIPRFTIADTQHPLEDDWMPFASLILNASYEATLAVAAKKLKDKKPNERISCFLTLLGGGVFGNKPAWIETAIKQAITKYQDWPIDVILVHLNKQQQGDWPTRIKARKAQDVVRVKKVPTPRLGLEELKSNPIKKQSVSTPLLKAPESCPIHNTSIYCWANAAIQLLWNIDGVRDFLINSDGIDTSKQSIYDDLEFIYPLHEQLVHKENAVKENRSEKISSKKDFPQKINFQRTYAAALRGVAAVS